MRIFYSISLVLFLSLSFAQNNKLKGIWVEYKREVIGDTNTSNYTFNGSIQTGDIYRFFEDSTFFFSEQGISDYNDINDYFFNHDTLNLILNSRRDCATPVLPYIISRTNANELILTDACDTLYYGVRRYFKKTKKLPKKKSEKYETVDEPAYFPGGQESLVKFLFENIDTSLFVPKSYRSKTITLMNLVIDYTGKIIDVKIPWHPEKKYVKESIRLARLMPNWIPAKSIQLNSSDINATPKNVISEVTIFLPITR